MTKLQREESIGRLKRSLFVTQRDWDEAWDMIAHHAAAIDFLAERGFEKGFDFLGNEDFQHLVESMAVFCLTSLALGKGKSPRKPDSDEGGGKSKENTDSEEEAS